ncbi:hypothetical protein EBR66_03620 [bacterium]|nr:hypothetical protein [bacterium]
MVVDVDILTRERALHEVHFFSDHIEPYIWIDGQDYILRQRTDIAEKLHVVCENSMSIPASLSASENSKSA